MGSKKRARQAANDVIAKARGFRSEDGGLEQVETKTKFINHEKENVVEIGNVPKGTIAREYKTSNVITFHVMKRGT